MIKKTVLLQGTVFLIYTTLSMNKPPLSNSFFDRTDVARIARELLGHVLVTSDQEGNRTSGIIVETEAYAGITDKASHAYGGRLTQRTATLYQAPGTIYVYLCYGIHHLFNLVTNQANIPHAVLIRAIQPIEGVELMMKRRGLANSSPRVTMGPGSLTKALGIQISHNKLTLGKANGIWIEPGLESIPADRVLSGPRIGVAYAGEDALLPYRFWLKDNPYVSPPRK